MTDEEIWNHAIRELIDPTPAWKHWKPCAICRADFMPRDHRQELCDEHQRQFSSSLHEP